MIIQFASCQRNYVLDFLQKGYPSKKLSWEHMPKLDAAIGKDIFRVTDPNHHTLALVEGTNYKKDEHEKLSAEIYEEISNHP